MNKDQYKAGVYVALNCLLDTRLATLLLISEDFALEVMQSKTYYTRQQDIFETPILGKLGKTLFKEVMENKKEEIIENSVRTKMFVFIQELCSNYLVQAIKTPFQTEVSLDINTYPYLLTDEAAQELLKVCVSLLGVDFNINIINVAPKDLTIKLCREKYKSMILYEYLDWLDIHQLELKKKPFKDTGLYVPKLIFGEPVKPEHQQELDDLNMDLFDLAKEGLNAILSIQFLPIATYCAAVPDNLPEYLTA